MMIVIPIPRQDELNGLINYVPDWYLKEDGLKTLSSFAVENIHDDDIFLSKALESVSEVLNEGCDIETGGEFFLNSQIINTSLYYDLLRIALLCFHKTYTDQIKMLLGRTDSVPRNIKVVNFNPFNGIIITLV